MKITIQAPGESAREVIPVEGRIPVQPGEVVRFEDTENPPMVMAREGDDLVVFFEDGTTVVLEGFFVYGEGEEPPGIDLGEGVLFTAEYAFEPGSGPLVLVNVPGEGDLWYEPFEIDQLGGLPLDARLVQAIRDRFDIDESAVEGLDVSDRGLSTYDGDIGEEVTDQETPDSATPPAAGGGGGGGSGGGGGGGGGSGSDYCDDPTMIHYIEGSGVVFGTACSDVITVLGESEDVNSGNRVYGFGEGAYDANYYDGADVFLVYAYGDSALIEENYLHGGQGALFPEGVLGNSFIFLAEATDSEDDAEIYDNTIRGGDDGNFVEFRAIASEGDDADIVGNDIRFGDGDDTVLLIADVDGTDDDQEEATGEGGETPEGVASQGDDANVVGNLISVGGGDDVISIVADAGSGDAYADNNEIGGGDGDNRITIASESNEGFSHVGGFIYDEEGIYVIGTFGNTIVSGDGADRIVLSAVSSSADAIVAFNEITVGDGANDVSLMGDGDATLVRDNAVTGGAGEDTIAISATATGYDAVIFNSAIDALEGENLITLAADAYEDAVVVANSISGGDLADSVMVTSRAETESSNVDANVIDLGHGDNSLVIDSYAVQGGVGGADEFVTADGNLVTSGNGANDVSISARNGYGDAFTTVNSVTTGGGDDTVRLNAFSSADDAYASGALIDVGSGTNQVTIRSEAQEEADSEGNTVLGGDADDTFVVQAVSMMEDAKVRGNLVQAGDGVNRVELSASADSTLPVGAFAYDAQVDANTVSGGAGDDLISLTASASRGKSTVDNNQVLAGDAGNNILLSSYTSSTLARDYASVIGNTLSGGDGMEPDTLAVISRAGPGSARAEARQNDFFGYGGDDILTIDVTSNDNPSAGILDVIQGNNLDGGSGDDVIRLSATGPNANIRASTIITGEGSDDVLLETTGDLAQAVDNTLLGGAAEIGGTGAADTLMIRADDDARRNILTGGDGDDLITVSTTGATNSYATYNVLTGDNGDGSGIEGDDILRITTFGDIGFTYGNVLSGDGGNDDLRIATYGYGAGIYSSQLSGGSGDDVFGLTAPGAGAIITANILDGGSGNDAFEVSASGAQNLQTVINSNTFLGGDGEDTLRSVTTGDLANFTGVSDVETLDLRDPTGTAGNRVTFLDSSQVLAMTDARNQLAILGDAAVDTVELGAGWGLDAGASLPGFNAYTHATGPATLQVQNDLVVTFLPPPPGLEGADEELDYTVLASSSPFDADGGSGSLGGGDSDTGDAFAVGAADLLDLGGADAYAGLMAALESGATGMPGASSFGDGGSGSAASAEIVTAALSVQPPAEAPPELLIPAPGPVPDLLMEDVPQDEAIALV